MTFAENPQHIVFRAMAAADYEEVYALWERIHGFYLRSVDDSKEYVCRFLDRNPSTSCVAELEGRIVGAVLCGHDGRQGSFYHVCVDSDFRKHGIGKCMVRFCLAALAREGISKATLVAFGDNEVGNNFWRGIGWTPRGELNEYEFRLNEENISRYVM